AHPDNNSPPCPVATERKASIVIPPRFIRLRDAPAYLGMDRSLFNLTVRPTLTEVTIGRQGVAFDRLDLDAWADEYMRRNGRAGKGASQKWRDEARPQESQPIVQETRRSTRSASRSAYLPGLAPSRSNKPRNTWPRASKPSAVSSYTESVLRRLSERQRSGI